MRPAAEQTSAPGAWDARAMHGRLTAGELPVDLSGFRAWLATTGLSTDVRDVELVAGGSQNVVLRLVLDGRRLILRYPPVHPRAHSNRALVREMQVLRALAGTDVPHPSFVAGQDDLESGEPVFYLMEEVDGFNPHVELADEYRDRPDYVQHAGISVVTALATLGTVDPGAIGLAGLGRPDTFRERQIDKQLELWRGFLERDSYDGDWLPGVPDVASWLHETMPPPAAPGLAHGDYQLGNLLLRRDVPEVAAILDWEMCTGGDPLIDLGYLLLCWPEARVPAILPTGTYLAAQPGFPTRAEAIEAYMAATPRDVTGVAWYTALAAFKMGIVIEANYVRSVDGKMDAALGEYSHRAARALLQTAGQIADGTWTGLDR